MSFHNVGVVIQALLVDEELRGRFAHSRIDAILELVPQGVILTEDEVQLFVTTDAQLWTWTGRVIGGRVH